MYYSVCNAFSSKSSFNYISDYSEGRLTCFWARSLFSSFFFPCFSILWSLTVSSCLSQLDAFSLIKLSTVKSLLPYEPSWVPFQGGNWAYPPLHARIVIVEQIKKRQFHFVQCSLDLCRSHDVHEHFTHCPINHMYTWYYNRLKLELYFWPVSSSTGGGGRSIKIHPSSNNTLLVRADLPWLLKILNDIYKPFYIACFLFSLVIQMTFIQKHLPTTRSQVLNWTQTWIFGCEVMTPVDFQPVRSDNFGYYSNLFLASQM